MRDIFFNQPFREIKLEHSLDRKAACFFLNHQIWKWCSEIRGEEQGFWSDEGWIFGRMFFQINYSSRSWIESAISPPKCCSIRWKKVGLFILRFFHSLVLLRFLYYRVSHVKKFFQHVLKMISQKSSLGNQTLCEFTF